VKPQVAVVIPTRNRSDALQRAVRSVLNQSYRDWELVVVDDGSSPKVELAPDAAKDDRVHLLRLDVSEGAGAARNRGVAVTSAPLIAFLDDDDEWLADKLSEQVSAMRDEAVDAVECGYDMFDGVKHVFRFEPLPDRDHYEVLLRRPCLQPSTLMVRRSAFDAVGGFDESVTRTEDWLFALDLAARSEVVTIPAPLVVRSVSRPHPGEMLKGYRQFLDRLASRLIDRDPKQVADLMSFHAVIEGTYMLESGDVAGARTKFRSSWRSNPLSWRPNVHLARSYLGERPWMKVKEMAYAVAGRIESARGKPAVPVRRW
jgi:glycosyltransferase involved in cell wall biosynthesis